MNLNFVRCLSPEMVRRELWTTLLAYNLIRTTICSAASLHGKRPREISFVSASQYILASWQEVTANLRGKQLESAIRGWHRLFQWVAQIVWLIGAGRSGAVSDGLTFREPCRLTQSRCQPGCQAEYHALD